MGKRTLVPATGMGLLVLAVLASAARGDDYLEAPATIQHDLHATGFTVEAWVKVVSLPGDDPHIVHARRFPGTNDSDVWELHVCKTLCSVGKASFSARSANTTVFQLTSLTSVSDGIWHHVAGTCDGNIARLYVDGALENSAAVAGVNVSVAGGHLYLGERGPGSVGRIHR